MMNVAHNIRLWRPIPQLVAVAVLLLPLNTIAGGQRPATHQIQMQGETLTNLTVSAGGGAVAQDGVPAAIYRSTGCGFQSWIGGQPAWLDQMVLFNVPKGRGKMAKTNSILKANDPNNNASNIVFFFNIARQNI